MAKKINLSNLLFSSVIAKGIYYKSGNTLRSDHSERCSKKHAWPHDTCALRVSLALSLCGKKLRRIDGSLVHTSCDSCGEKKKHVLNQRARRFTRLLKGGVVIKNYKEIPNARGILFIDKELYDHITFWDYNCTVDGTDYHKSNVLKLVFWKIGK